MTPSESPPPPNPQAAPRRRSLGPGAIHTGMVSLIEQDPGVILAVLEQQGLVPAGWHIQVLPTARARWNPEGRLRIVAADVALRLWPHTPPPPPINLQTIRAAGCRSVSIDKQMRVDGLKEVTIPEYAIAYAAYAGEVAVIVIVTFRDSVERWIHETVAPKLGNTKIIVIRPDMVPRLEVLDPENYPAHVLLNAMFHARTLEDVPLVIAALRALNYVPEDPMILLEMLHSHLDEELMMAAKQALEDEFDIDMDYELSEQEMRSYFYVRGERAGRARGVEEGREEGREEGHRRGQAAALLEILHHRGLAVDDAARAEILGCPDVVRLRRWLARSLDVESVAALLRD